MNTPSALLRQPALDPDGQQLAFITAGDVWLVSIEGGIAERLTAHPARHYQPRFSPDGQHLLFGAGRDGAGDLYVLNLAGGAPQQLTFQDEPCYPQDWASDGEAVYFTSDIEQMGYGIYRVGISGGTPAPIYLEPYEQLDQVAVAPDGQQLAFVNVRERWWRRGPHPSSPNEVWLGPAYPDYRALCQYAGPYGQRFRYAGKLGWRCGRPMDRDCILSAIMTGTRISGIFRLAKVSHVRLPAFVMADCFFQQSPAGTAPLSVNEVMGNCGALIH